MKTDTLERELSTYVCIDPKSGDKVYSYFNELLDEVSARQFEEHLLICFSCQDIVFRLDQLSEVLRPEMTSFGVPPDGARSVNSVPKKPKQQKDKPDKNIIIPVEQTIVVVNDRLLIEFQNNPEALRRIDPFVFEKVVAELFEEQGYEVTITSPRADGGKDIYVYKKDPITNLMFLVECKRYVPPNTVGVEIARQLYGVVQRERANAGIIVTTSYFTKPAKEFAAGVPYQLFLRDFDYLLEWIKRNQKA